MAQIRTISELKQMQRAQLKSINKDVLIDCILASRDTDETTGQELDGKLAQIVSDLADLKRSITAPESTINQKLMNMQAQIDKQSEIIAQHQLFFERVDRRERETKLIVFGVPEDGEDLEGSATDGDKLKKIWAVLDERYDICKHQRLGQHGMQGNRKRPILVEFKDKQVRDSVLSKTKKLKESSDPFKRIYIKKDVHPSVRKEWKRLREAETAEKNRPENVGCTIRLDVKERKLYRDDIVIDRWNPCPF